INSQYNARVDHHFSDKNSLFARYAYWKADSNAYDAWGTNTQGQGHTGIYTHSAILGDTHAFNSSTILDFAAFLPAGVSTRVSRQPRRRPVSIRPRLDKPCKPTRGAGQLPGNEFQRQPGCQWKQWSWFAALLAPECVRVIGKSHQDC